jgi:hypothetical protein
MFVLAAVGIGALVGLIVSRLLKLRPEPSQQAPASILAGPVNLTFAQLEDLLAPYEPAA